MKKAGISLLVGVSLSLLALPLQAQFTTQWEMGAPNRGWPIDMVGGGPDVDFVHENEAPDDYYFAGTYPAPVGTLANDDISAERAFSGADNTFRIHFNLPTSLTSGTEARFAFAAFNLEGNLPSSYYGIEARFNGELVMSEQIVRIGDLHNVITSPGFFLGDVGAQFGPGGDNVIELTGYNYSGEGGGNWMGWEYHALEVNVVPEPSSLALMGVGGLLGLGVFLRRRR